MIAKTRLKLARYSMKKRRLTKNRPIYSRPTESRKLRLRVKSLTPKVLNLFNLLYHYTITRRQGQANQTSPL